MKVLQEEFWFTILRQEDLRGVWHPELELIFMLKGTGQIYSDNRKMAFTLREKDIFAVNSFEMQKIELEVDAVALSLSVAPRFIASVSPEILRYKIDCRSFLHAEDKQNTFDALRCDLAMAFQNQYKRKGEHTSAPYQKSRVAAVLENLNSYFLDTSQPVDNKGGRESLKKAVHFIQQNYKNKITLEDLSRQLFLSKTYISHSFTKHMGITFTGYLTLVRLSQASKMVRGKENLVDIAYESGFPNVNAMINAFKQYWGITPGEYRKSIKQNRRTILLDERQEEEKDLFSSLIQYADATMRKETLAAKIQEINVDISGRKQNLAPHWKRILNAGYARSMTEGMVQEEIRYLQNKIGFEYIRIKGILDDDMCLLRMDMNGNIIMNYAYLNQVLDFILSVGAKPMIELGYMPQLLAREKAAMSMRHSTISVPNNLKQWSELIRLLMEHLTQRYRQEKVRTWMFAPWLSVDFELCTLEEYENIYSASYHAIKSVNANYLTTGPGTSEGKKYLEWYLGMCRRRHCMPDIFTFRSYAASTVHEEEGLKLIGNNESFPMAVSGDENFLQNKMKEIFDILQKEGLGNVQLVLEEWSNNIWQRDLCNDTCFKSAYLFKNILENNQNFHAMGYFTLNDRLDEVPPSEEMFHGGFGLFTQNDIPKSACRALELLNAMGEKLVQRGEGYFITERKNEIQIFLYNYCHYDLLYRYRHVANMGKIRRYDVFVQREPQAFYIHLEHMEPGNYRIRRYGITREAGSSYDMWVKMGAPDPMNQEEKAMLEYLSHPKYSTETIEVPDCQSAMNIKASLDPLDVWLIKINIS